MLRVGLPRGLLYYQYYPLYRVFFQALGAEVVSSPPTDGRIFAAGCQLLPVDICLPVKVYCGHVAYLADRCDLLFIPSIKSLSPKIYNCPKFIGLPDIVRASLSHLPKLLEPDIDFSRGRRHLYQQIYRLARPFTRNPLKVNKAVRQALETYRTYRKYLRELPLPQAMQKVIGEEVAEEQFSKASLRVGLVGHPYLLYDNYLNHRAVEKLKKLGVKVHFPEQVEEEVEKLVWEVSGRPYWTYEGEVIGAGEHYLRNQVDGVIALVAFGCGPDSLMVRLLERRAQDLGRPFLSLVLDQHTTDSVIDNRLEAFVDLVSKGREGAKSFTWHRGKEKGRIMALGIPPMGNVPAAFRQSARMLGIELLAPPVTQRTLSLGTRYSPEFVCLPFKLILGSFIESLEQGADSLFMVTSFDACRMGYYSRVQERILQELGYKFQFLKYESSGKNLLKVLRAVKEFTNNSPWARTLAAYRLGVAKLRVLDELERRLQRLRPVELEKGTADRVYREAVAAIDRAENLQALRKTAKQVFGRLELIPHDPQADPLKVRIIGEIYVITEPFCNLDLERELGRLGVEVRRSRTTFLSEWTRPSAYLNFLSREKRRLRKFAEPYLKRDVGGHGLESVAEKARSRELDGFIHLVPFTCLPETIAQTILPRVPNDLPVLTIVLDEELTKGALTARLEAFVDLLHLRRRQRPST